MEYFSLLKDAENSEVVLDAGEHYVKQSYRNRCRILTSLGVQDLRVPVLHSGDLFKTPVGKVLVDWDSTPWLRRTKYAIETAYSSSPFFEYYRDELFAILDASPERLWDLNQSIIDFFCRKIGLGVSFCESETYLGGFSAEIHPKRPSGWEAKPYWQVFRDRFGFIGNLSVMDLLFCEGPESICYL